ncbi:MAG: hypothetical protein PHQ01_03345 [Candidatus Pacebacteria bacterium]|nr:hypothetical protein [Candidatus Paceibacterota bacterium]
MKKSKSEKKKQKDREGEADKVRKNLFGFFSLLLEVDKRVNNYLYKNKEK